MGACNEVWYIIRVYKNQCKKLRFEKSCLGCWREEGRVGDVVLRTFANNRTCTKINPRRVHFLKIPRVEYEPHFAYIWVESTRTSRQKKVFLPLQKEALRARARAWHNEMFVEFHLWAVAYICWTVLEEDGKLFTSFSEARYARSLSVGRERGGGCSTTSPT